MSTAYYARRKEPRLVYDEYEIGKAHANYFTKTHNSDGLNFVDEDALIDFIKNTELFEFYNEYNEKISPEDMVMIIKK